MFGFIKRAGKEGIIYGIGQGLHSALAFILVPLYTRNLTQSEFGKLGLLVPVGAVASILLSMGLNSAIFRSYFDYDDAEGRKLVVNTTLVLLATTTLFTLLLGLPLIPALSKALFAEVESGTLIWLIVVKSIASSYGAVPLAIYRAHSQSVKYVVITLAALLLKVFVIIYLVVVERWGLMGVIGGDAGTTVIATTAMLWTIRKEIVSKFSLNEARKLLAFGLPLVPADLASMVFARADLFFLNRYTDLSTVGQYHAAAIVVTAIQVLIKTPFMLIWVPMILSVEKKEFAKEFYSRITIYILTITGFLALFISLFSGGIIGIVAGFEYRMAAKVLPLLCLAQIFYISQISFSAGITLKRKTQYVPLVLAVVAAATLIANFILIPVWGMIGAGVASVISSITFALLTYVVSQRIYYIHQKWGRIAKILLFYTLTFVVISATNTFMINWFLERLRLLLSIVLTLGLSLASVWFSLERDEKEIAKQKLIAIATEAGISPSSELLRIIRNK